MKGDGANPVNGLRQGALKMLVRRDHTAQELKTKLKQKPHDPVLIAQVITELQEEGLQSDLRFAQMYTRMRVNRGYGPLRIRMELQERGVDVALIDECLLEYESQWMGLLTKARDKRFGKITAVAVDEQAKQMRFLQYRGFSAEHIRRVFSNKC